MVTVALGTIHWKTDTFAIGRIKCFATFGDLAVVPGFMGKVLIGRCLCPPWSDQERPVKRALDICRRILSTPSPCTAIGEMDLYVRHSWPHCPPVSYLSFILFSFPKLPLFSLFKKNLNRSISKDND